MSLSGRSARRSSVASAEDKAGPNALGWRERVALWLVLFAAVLSPLPFGSTDGRWIAIWCVVFSTALLIVPLDRLRNKRLWLLLPMFLVLLAYAGLVAYQIVGSPGSSADPVWGEARRVLGDAVQPHATVTVGAPWRAAGHPLVLALSFLATFIVAAREASAWRIVAVLGYAIAAYALYAILARILWPGMLLWIEKTAYTSSLTGTFVNRNTAATFFGTGCVLWLLAFLVQAKRVMDRERDGLGEGADRLMKIVLSRELLLPFGCLLVCLAATFLTASRAGIVFTGLCCIIAAALYVWRTWPAHYRSWTLLLPALLLLLGLAQLWGGLVSARLNAFDFFEDQRWIAYSGVIQMIKDHPLTGVGLGAFPDIFPAYRPANLPQTQLWTLAHSTPLETAAELGLPMMGAIALLWAFYAVILLRGSFRRRRGLFFPIMGLSVAVLGTLHSSFDFSLQIPGYSILFGALLGVALSQAMREQA